MTWSNTARFNLGLSEKELHGYSWYVAMMCPSNWVSIGSLVLAMISIVMHIHNGWWCRDRQQPAEAVVAVTNVVEPVAARTSRVSRADTPVIIFQQRQESASAPAAYGVLEVTEQLELVLVKTMIPAHMAG